MKIYNSMTGKKEEFVPLDGKNIKMYACGVTVYDLCHIGHARQAIVYAMIADYFRFRGYNLRYVRNFTDVDDKIINRANERGVNALDFSREQIEEANKDMDALHVTKEDITTKASEYIDKIISFVQGLIDKGYAYSTSKGDVYYIVRKFDDYGKLSNRKIDELLNGVRKEVEEGKRDPLDFALWKSAKEGEIYWESPWGKGRPGWHIECSVMIYNTLGETIDIHGGGRDLVFPHHENEIAQSEALTGKPLAKYWSHCGLVKINGEKMSKSLGNSLTIRDALKDYNYEVIKYVMLSRHYASDIDIHDKDYEVAESHLYYFYNTLLKMNEFVEKYGKDEAQGFLDDDISKDIEKNFIEAMDDDFNTSSVLGYLHNIFKYVNNYLKPPKKNIAVKTSNTLAKILDEIKRIYGVIGFFKQDPEQYIKEAREKYLKKLGISEALIQEKIQERKDAKSNKDYEKADKIRGELDEKGIVLNDTPEGTFWDIKALF